MKKFELYIEKLHTLENWDAYLMQESGLPGRISFFCGTMGLGRLLEQGKTEFRVTLRALSSDPRWRTREAVAMACRSTAKGI